MMTMTYALLNDPKYAELVAWLDTQLKPACLPLDDAALASWLNDMDADGYLEIGARYSRTDCPVTATFRIGSGDDKQMFEAELPDLPTPEQEPDAEVRRQIACRLPADRLPDRLPTPEQEPDVYVRWQVAYRLPADRLPGLLTPEQEPDVYVREWVAKRLSADRLPDLLTPEQEPDVYVRRLVTRRRADRLPDLPTPEQEPDEGMHMMLVRLLPATSRAALTPLSRSATDE